MSKPPGQTDSQFFSTQRKFSSCAQLAFRRRLWSSSKSTQSSHRLATQHKSTQVDRKPTVYVWKLRLSAWRLAWTYITSRLANPFGHPSQVDANLQNQNLRRTCDRWPNGFASRSGFEKSFACLSVPPSQQAKHSFWKIEHRLNTPSLKQISIAVLLAE